MFQPAIVASLIESRKMVLGLLSLLNARANPLSKVEPVNLRGDNKW